MMPDSHYTQKAVLHSFLAPSQDTLPPARRALQELPQLQQAASCSEAMRVCEDWAKGQNNNAGGNAAIFGVASELYKERTTACRSAAERVLQTLTRPDRVGVSHNQRLAVALMLDSLDKPYQARAALGREPGADATVEDASGSVLLNADTHERERLHTRLNWWPWLRGKAPAALPQTIAFTDPLLGPVALSLAVGADNS